MKTLHEPAIPAGQTWSQLHCSNEDSGIITRIGINVLAGVIAYLCGAIPTGYWLGKLLKDIDIREHGSKSTGATNVLRTLGKGPGFAALLIDLLKGVAAVIIARWLYALPSVIAVKPAAIDLGRFLPWALTSAVLLAIIGHSRSIWIGFSGGKSAATGLGVLLALSWPVGLGVVIAFGAVLGVLRIVSLSSIAAAIIAVILMVAFHQPPAYVLMAIAGAAYVVWRHKANIQRLLAGVEPEIGHMVDQ